MRGCNETFDLHEVMEQEIADVLWGIPVRATFVFSHECPDPGVGFAGSTSARLTSATIGRRTFTRDDMVLMLGEEHLARIEDLAAAKVVEGV